MLWLFEGDLKQAFNYYLAFSNVSSHAKLISTENVSTTLFSCGTLRNLEFRKRAIFAIEKNLTYLWKTFDIWEVSHIPPPPPTPN